MMPAFIRQLARVSFSALVVAACAAGATRAAYAQAPSVLPAVDLMRLDGVIVPGATLAQTGPWVMLVTLDRCPACGPVLDGIAAAVAPPQAARLTVVLGGMSRPQAQVVAPGVVGLAGARWFVDPDRTMLQALSMSATPLLVGVRDDRIAWTRAAAGMTEAQLRAVLSSWIR